jgi:hypothetical protein
LDLLDLERCAGLERLERRAWSRFGFQPAEMTLQIGSVYSASVKMNPAEPYENLSLKLREVIGGMPVLPTRLPLGWTALPTIVFGCIRAHAQ